MQLNKVIQTRHSVKKFKSKKPNWRTIIECIDATRFTPMAGNNFTLKFILVDDEKKIAQLAQASQQPFVGTVHYIVVLCSDCSRTINSYGERGKIYCRQQAGAAIQTFLLKIQETKLATTWVGHFVEDQIKRILNIPEEIQIEAIFPIGYEVKERTTKKHKIELDNIIYFNQYKNKKMVSSKKIDS